MKTATHLKELFKKYKMDNKFYEFLSVQIAEVDKLLQAKKEPQRTGWNRIYEEGYLNADFFISSYELAHFRVLKLPARERAIIVNTINYMLLKTERYYLKNEQDNIISRENK